jgi:hypothetical protein
MGDRIQTADRERGLAGVLHDHADPGAELYNEVVGIAVHARVLTGEPRRAQPRRARAER